MIKRIASHRFKNDKSISVGITDKEPSIPKCDTFYLEFRNGHKKIRHYLRPDEVMLLVKLLSTLLLKRVMGYTVNLGRSGDRDYR